MSYQVGTPWMFDGKIFLPETGTPIRKIDCMSNAFALALPVPLTLAILKAKSLTAAGSRKPEAGSTEAGSTEAGSTDSHRVIERLRRPHPASGFRLPALQTHTE